MMLEQLEQAWTKSDASEHIWRKMVATVKIELEEVQTERNNCRRA